MAAISEYISSVISERDDLITYRRKQGFLRERTSTDEENRRRNEKYLVSYIFSSMEAEFGMFSPQNYFNNRTLNETSMFSWEIVQSQQLERTFCHIEYSVK